MIEDDDENEDDDDNDDDGDDDGDDDDADDGDHDGDDDGDDDHEGQAWLKLMHQKLKVIKTSLSKKLSPSKPTFPKRCFFLKICN